MNLLDELAKQHSSSTDKMVRGRFITQLSMLFEGFNKRYTMTEILHTLLRKEGEKKGEKETPYVWSDEKLLKKAEELYKKMVKEEQEDND